MPLRTVRARHGLHAPYTDRTFRTRAVSAFFRGSLPVFVAVFRKRGRQNVRIIATFEPKLQQMDRFRKLRHVIVLLLVLFALGLILLIVMVPTRTFLTWAVAVTQTVVAAYFGVVSFGLLKELQEKEHDEEE